MVRPGYRVNEFTDPLAIFNQTNPTSGLNAFGEFPKSWAIDWQRFIDLGMGPKPESNQDRVQLAYKIDTSLVNPLAHLPHSVAGDEATADPHLFSLAFRNLRRGVILGLPSGQDVAKAMGLTPLPDSDIRIGSATGNVGDAPAITTIAGGVFNGKCPLWAYILAEGRKNFFDHGKAQLGPVGGRIVAEVFLGLLTQDGSSFLSVQPDWKPTLGQGGHFTLADLLKVALHG